jgi:hypothetical protein
MSLTSLACIELQLVMQCCDRSALLQLARCCRATMTAAEAPFAWLHVAPLPLEFTSALNDPHVVVPYGRLLRHVRLAVRWTCAPNNSNNKNGSQDPVSEAEMAGMVRLLPRVRVLNASGRQLHKEDLLTLLRIEGVELLQSLVLHKGNTSALDVESLRLIADRLPRLHTLGAALSHMCTERAMEPFIGSKYLTHLRLFAQSSAAVQGSASLGQLRNLYLFTPSCDSSWLPRLRGSSALGSSLRHLELVSTDPMMSRGAGSQMRNHQAPNMQEQHDIFFAHLPLLESLVLRQCPHVHTMLPAVLSHCSQLRLLVLEPVLLWRSHVADSALLARLLVSRPACVLELHVPSLKPYMKARGNVDDTFKDWTLAQRQWEPLRAHERVRFVETNAVAPRWG